MKRYLNPEATIVILTGAGISRESGLETFRCKDGIWAKVNLEDVCTPEGYQRNPQMLQDFYNARRAQLVDEKPAPNPAHYALAKLEKEWQGDVLIVTQNIDNLHELAGSQNIIHMHGELLKVRCTACHNLFECHEDVHLESICPSCQSRGTVRPHVVWFGEMPLEMERIYKTLEECELFISIGTSGNVYPAAGFVQAVSIAGDCHSVELNLEPSNGATLFNETIYGPASEVVPDYIETLLCQD